MQKSKIVFMLLMILFILTTCFIIFEPTKAIYNYFSNINANGIDQKHFRLINMVFIVPFVVFFTIIGFVIAKKKGRNKALWTVLSLLFNFWAVIALLLLPGKNRLRTGPGSD